MMDWTENLLSFTKWEEMHTNNCSLYISCTYFYIFLVLQMRGMEMDKSNTLKGYRGDVVARGQKFIEFYTAIHVYICNQNKMGMPVATHGHSTSLDDSSPLYQYHPW